MGPGQGAAVLPPAMVRNEVESGQLRALRTKPDVGFGTLVIAFVGPIHRYRPDDQRGAN
jgi:hypothetical protein